jgi:cysteinyl-tRNA synthetase
LSMPRAAAALFSLIKAAEQELKKATSSSSEQVDMSGLRAIWDAVLSMDSVFGIFDSFDAEENTVAESTETETDAPPDVLELVDQRTAAKNAKDWALADSLRQRITDLGWSVKDVKGGEPIVSKL